MIKGKTRSIMDIAILAMAHNLKKLMRKTQNELMERVFTHLSRLRKPGEPHTALFETNNRIYRIAAEKCAITIEDDVLRLKEVVSVTFDTTSC